MASGRRQTASPSRTIRSTRRRQDHGGRPKGLRLIGGGGGDSGCGGGNGISSIQAQEIECHQGYAAAVLRTQRMEIRREVAQACGLIFNHPLFHGLRANRLHDPEEGHCPIKASGRHVLFAIISYQYRHFSPHVSPDAPNSSFSRMSDVRLAPLR